MVKTYLISISPKIILNLTHPGRLGPVIRNWKGKHDWFDQRYDPLRELIEVTYVYGFNKRNGHYDRLAQSIRDKGITNPVMLANGGPHVLPRSQVPPIFRGDPFVIMSEYLGGSRIYIAENLKLPRIPAILNDHSNFITDLDRNDYGFDIAKELKSKADVIACFDRPPGIVDFDPHHKGAYVNNMVYSHMKPGYNLAEQVRVRQAVLKEVQLVVAKWLKENDA